MEMSAESDHITAPSLTYERAGDGWTVTIQRLPHEADALMAIDLLCRAFATVECVCVDGVIHLLRPDGEVLCRSDAYHPGPQLNGQPSVRALRQRWKEGRTVCPTCHMMDQSDARRAGLPPLPGADRLSGR